MDVEENREWLRLSLVMYNDVKSKNASRTESELPFTIEDFQDTLAWQRLMLQSRMNHEQLEMHLNQLRNMKQGC